MENPRDPHLRPSCRPSERSGPCPRIELCRATARKMFLCPLFVCSRRCCRHPCCVRRHCRPSVLLVPLVQGDGPALPLFSVFCIALLSPSAIFAFRVGWRRQAGCQREGGERGTSGRVAALCMFVASTSSLTLNNILVIPQAFALDVIAEAHASWEKLVADGRARKPSVVYDPTPFLKKPLWTPA